MIFNGYYVKPFQYSNQKWPKLKYSFYGYHKYLSYLCHRKQRDK
jgi:hypothetical protein